MQWLWVALVFLAAVHGVMPGMVLQHRMGAGKILRVGAVQEGQSQEGWGLAGWGNAIGEYLNKTLRESLDPPVGVELVYFSHDDLIQEVTTPSGRVIPPCLRRQRLRLFLLPVDLFLVPPLLHSAPSPSFGAGRLRPPRFIASCHGLPRLEGVK